MENLYDLKIYDDFYGVFESLMSPIKKDIKKKLVAELNKRGVAKKWYGGFFKMATFYKVVYHPCDCSYDEEKDCSVDEWGNECCCDQEFVDVGNEYIPLSKWENYVQRHHEGEQVALYSDDGLYPSLSELLSFDIDGIKFNLPLCDGFSLYADTEENDKRLYSISFVSGYFECNPDFLKGEWGCA